MVGARAGIAGGAPPAEGCWGLRAGIGGKFGGAAPADPT